MQGMQLEVSNLATLASDGVQLLSWPFLDIQFVP